MTDQKDFIRGDHLMPNRQEILKTSRKHFSTTVLLTSQMLFYYAKHDDNDDGSELLVLKLLNFFWV